MLKILTILALLVVLVSAQRCGQGEQWNECGSHCEGTCDQPDRVCILSCGLPSCSCKQGFVRNNKGVCIPQARCPSRRFKRGCETVRCRAGKVCKEVQCFAPPCHGICVDAPETSSQCDGVTCPQGQTCQEVQCFVAPCKGICV